MIFVLKSLPRERLEIALRFWVVTGWPIMTVYWFNIVSKWSYLVTSSQWYSFGELFICWTEWIWVSFAVWEKYFFYLQKKVKLKINHIIPSSLSSSQHNPPPITFPKIQDLFFFIIVILVYKCKKIKVNWLSLFDVPCVYEFRANHLVLNNLLGGSSLPLLVVINCLYLFIKGWCPARFHLSTSACLLVLSLFRSWLSSHMLKYHGWSFFCIIFRRYNLAEDFWALWFLQSFHPSSLMSTESQFKTNG